MLWLRKENAFEVLVTGQRTIIRFTNNSECPAAQIALFEEI